MRRSILIFGLMMVAGAAEAGDYVVVASSDPGLLPGQELDGGQQVALGAGRSVTLVHVGGELTVLRGGASGVVVPTRRVANTDASRIAALKSLIAPPAEGRTFGGRRGGICPDPADLRTVDQVLSAQAGGCAKQAREAFAALANSAGTP